MANFKKFEKFVPTDEDWYPSFDPKQITGHMGQNLLEVSAVHITCSNAAAWQGKKTKVWHVSVWGADDMGMEIWDLTQDEALSLYRKLKTAADVTQNNLRQLGFINA